jgi:hypothetical protein
VRFHHNDTRVFQTWDDVGEYNSYRAPGPIIDV